MNRRQVIIGLGLTPMAASLLACSRMGGQDDDDDTVDYLFVQNAERVSLNDGTLTLSDVNSATIFFSDRPDRIAGHLPTDEFVEHWGTGGDDSFAADPPNAALSILNGPEPQDIIVVLKSPRLEARDLIYDVEVLEGNETAVGAASSLFIDVIGRPLTPVSVAGVERRTVRRAVR